jgi:hypothetical protein
MPDGNHFIMLDPTVAGELTVALNWRADLRSRMSGGAAR